MRIAMTGASGLIGQALTAHFSAAGHQVIAIKLRASMHQLDPLILEGVDVVIHLAGATVAAPWTQAYKQEIIQSRIKPTQLLCATLAALKQKPKVMISASGIGYYGNGDAQVHFTERSRAGTGFLADVCRRWEEETASAAEAGIRLVHLRIGVVLSKKGGALAKMWWPFQLGLGGRLGTGTQTFSWIALDEIPCIVDHLLHNASIAGPVNVVAPQPVSNAEFTKTLGQVINRPTFFSIPEFMLKLLLGEMGQTLLLSGSYVVPARLQETQYQFQYPDLKTALEKVTR